MEHEPNRPSQGRENMLAVSLVILVGAMILFYLYLITLGIVGNLLAGVGILVLIAAMHYVVWGRSFSAEVAAEREALRRQDEREARPRAKPPSDAIQDISRTQGIQKR
jgi:hypothetical protein